ncbi:hypothetical protein Pen02_30960 [Plantactinospora endophytica]|uniref:Uncharacterized protein n=1 Tax=Plantactinospora endophytica TaxID=673535 RepID=A0ABQ4E0D2_9ACTN|nr:hypothetical protein Pen02_30960 [Plantactinospora endophytica]
MTVMRTGRVPMVEPPRTEAAPGPPPLATNRAGPAGHHRPAHRGGRLSASTVTGREGRAMSGPGVVAAPPEQQGERLLLTRLRGET